MNAIHYALENWKGITASKCALFTDIDTAYIPMGYCEYYASRIAEKMGMNAIHYALENWKGITASKCALFTDIDTAYIPMGKIVES